MELLWIFIIWIINFAISWFNAYTCGIAWVDTKHAGGWPRFMCWMGAIMSASGFTWCFLFLISGGLYLTGYVEIPVLMVALQLGYIIIIPGVLFSGFMIMIDSWAAAYRERDLASFGIAGWNTYAQIHNTYNAVQGFGPALDNVLSFVKENTSSSSDDNDHNRGLVILVFAIVGVSLLAGILLTSTIIQKTAGNYKLPLKS